MKMPTFRYMLAFGLIGLILCGSTLQKKKFKGDLYFKLITIGSYCNADSTDIKKFDNTLDSLMKVDKSLLSKDDLELVDIYGGLKKNGLIDKPFFNIRIDSMSGYIVYTSPSEFMKVKDFNHDDLIKENKKVRLELTGEVVNLGTINVLYCTSIDKLEKVDGKTYWSK